MNLLKRALYHFVPLAIFFVVASVFFSPLYTGKILVQSDNIQLTGVNKEVADYQEKGEDIFWNSKEFSGVPLQKSSSYNLFGFVNRLMLSGSIIPKPVIMAMYLFLGMYLLFQVFGVSRWLSTLGGFAFSFSTFNIISIEVGHDNKVLAMALMAPVLAGIIYAYRGELLKGSLITVLAAGFQLYFGHIQITYYSLMMVLGYLLIVVYQTVRSKKWNEFLKISGVLVVATIVAFGCNFTKLASTLEYKDYSTRGGSELTKDQSPNVSSDGLDKDYALSWSSGKSEILTLVFPYFHGGASSEKLSQDSEVYKALASRGVDRAASQNLINNIPLYWGTQPFTGGPIYFGAVIFFLFILSLLVIDGPLKWWAIGLTLISLLLSMGKNLEWFTDIFFYYVPLYNKFRSVTMILSIAQLIVPFMGILMLDKIMKREIANERLAPKLLQAAAAIVGLGLFLVFFKNSFFDFRGQNDAAYGFPQWLLDALVADRKSLYTTDIIRSIVFVGLAAGALWLYLKNIIKPAHTVIAIALFTLVDLWAVNKRYLGEDDFQTKRRTNQTQFQPTQADQQILQDNSHYRVFNLAAQNPFSDGITSYYHYSVLGYSAIKMQRYQEIIDKYFREVNYNILGMLNAKYLIVKGQNGPQAQRNPSALGNAWLVKELKEVANADDEIGAIGSIDLSNEVVYDKRFGEQVAGTSFTGNGTISLSNYHPEKMTYSFSSDESQFAVFSEMFYDPGWNAYIDGESINHIRVDYVLRGLEIPAGNHEVVFKYEPRSISLGTYVILFSSFLLLVFMGLILFTSLKKTSEEN